MKSEMGEGKITLEYSTFLGRVRGALKILLFGRATYAGPWLVHHPDANKEVEPRDPPGGEVA